MESDDDFELFSPADTTPPSPINGRKLKRLKKAAEAALDRASPASEEPIGIQFDGRSRELESEPGSAAVDDAHESDSASPKFVAENELDSGSGGSGEERDPEVENGLADSDGRGATDFNPARCDEGNELGSGNNGNGARRALEFDSVDEKLDALAGDGDEEGDAEGNEDSGRDPSEKNRDEVDVLVDDRDDGKEKEKKKKGKTLVDEDEMHEARPTNKRRAEKERRDRLKQLRVDSQRLLREGRDAAFKPAPLVQKPISSILEKIRQRKLEISKKSVMLRNSSACTYSDSLGDDMEFELEIFQNQKDIKDTAEKVSIDEIVEGSKEKGKHSNASPNHVSNDNTKQSDQGSFLGQMELFSDSQGSDKKDDSLDESPYSPVEEVFKPSLLALNLKLDPSPQDDMSDEEYNDKENMDPDRHQSIDLSSSPGGDPVKDLIDEEAEEEDDSDNDGFHSKENEEEEDMGDAEELNDMIAANYEEKPIDNERRNQLHQEWLEQQDAAGTENLMQRLKCGQKQREALRDLEVDDDDIQSDEGEEFGSVAEGLASGNVARMNLRKAKQMMAEMFTDKEDTYMSSDDEEFDKRLAMQSITRKTELHASLLSPAEDENSREVFHRIRKLNIIPDSKKKPKSSSRFDALLTGCTTNGLSKPSFLGRGSNSVPSSKSHKTSAVRTFIFGRDDSNSRSAISASEDSSDTIQEETRRVRTSIAKYSGSQICTQTAKTAAAVSSSTSLYDLLRHSSSVHLDQCARETVVSQTESIFSAFRVGTKPKDSRT